MLQKNASKKCFKKRGSHDFLNTFQKVTTEHTGLGDATQLAAEARGRGKRQEEEAEAEAKAEVEAEAEAQAEANAKGRGRGKGSRDFLNTFQKVT